MRALVVGYGRAGRRHAALAQSFGLDVVTVDPNAESEFLHFASLQDALRADGHYDLAVICTPPALHVEHAAACQAVGLRVLCEKPLCALGQLEQARALGPLMVAYNYRYHPVLVELDIRDWWSDGPAALYASQQRERVPEWGLLLDHVSHDLDILNWLFGPLQITGAGHDVGKGWQGWKVWGQTGGCYPFQVTDLVTLEPTDRMAALVASFDWTPITADPAMFTDMWRAFLEGKNEPGLQEALETQELLEEVARVAGNDVDQE
jgi:predicted dehydrogenase